MPAKFIKSIGRTLDARPDRVDLRDREFTPRVVSLPEQWPDDATVRRLLPRYCSSGLVLDQGEEGACTGFGLACVVNYLRWRSDLTSKGPRAKPHAVSARMLYHLARFYDEWPGEDYDGSSCRGALKAWHKHGVCSDKLWPYRDADGRVRFVSPHENWAREALQCRLGVYYRVNRSSVVDMQAAILEIGAMYVSSEVHDGWGVTSHRVAIKGHASLPVIKAVTRRDSLGGHAYALVGFNRVGFVVQNSWGLNWANKGFAILPYEEWVRYGTDAWVAALGVPASTEKMSCVPIRSKEQMLMSRAGGIAFTSSAKPLPPPVKPQVAPWSAEEAYRHTVVMGNDGQLINRIVTHENAAACVRDVVCDGPLGFFKSGAGPKRLVIYAHGGLNSEDASIERIQTLGPYFKANNTYPVFLTWRTGPVETLAAILEDELGKVPRPEGDIGEVFERVKETAADALDRTIEVLAGPAAKAIWSQMKQNAQMAAEPSRAFSTLVAALAALKARHANVEIHLVGHSAGSILLGHLLDLLPAKKLPVASCHLYAPACTLRFALDHYVPAIENKLLARERLHIHLLSDTNELGDTVGPYRKSLLYLVSRALESCHRMPLLGLEQAFDPKWTRNWHDGQQQNVKVWQKFWTGTGNGLDVVTDKQVSTGLLGRRIQAAHGSFDNDAATIELTLRRITGAAPAFPVEWIDY
jgi:papain like protease